MSEDDENKKNLILFVDDEEKALKYFHRAFDKHFQIITASSADEGWSMIEENSENIAVLISDQRMPGRTGVELLGQVRAVYPRIMRILTTAYSELNDAIEAVNEGAIYQYVVKPWDVRELKAVLKRAIDYYKVQSERDILLKEKMSVLQRLIITDRVHSFSVLAAGLENNLNHSMTALASFLDLLPKDLQKEWTRSLINDSREYWFDIGKVAKNESQSILTLVKNIVSSTVEPNTNSLEEVSLEELIRPGLVSASKLAVDTGGSLEVDLNSELPKFKLNAAKINSCLSTLMDKMVLFCDPGTTICFSATQEIIVGETTGALINIYSKGKKWDESKVARLFSVFTQDNEPGLSLSLLIAFFVIYNHGGEISFYPSSEEGGGIKILLPFNPEEVKWATAEENCLEKLTSHFESWDVDNL